MSTQPVLAFLGPEGTFTHAAALTWAERGEPRPFNTVADVFAGLEDGTVALGVVAIESSVEGYVVTSLDELIGAHDVVAVDEAALDIEFDAFVVPDSNVTASVVTAHPHGLAQCQNYIRSERLIPVPAASNGAACRDVTEGQVALGPRLCGDLYGLRTLAQGVQDFSGARTRFLLVASRAAAQGILAEQMRPGDEPPFEEAGHGAEGRGASPGGTDPDNGWRTMLAVTPHEIGPGVLARITATLGSLGVNMTSLITRPLKAQESTYVFVVTLDGAPWERPVRAVFSQLLAAGDSLKTLGVFPSRTMFDGAFDSARIPHGSVRATSSPAEQMRALLW